MNKSLLALLVLFGCAAANAAHPVTSGSSRKLLQEDQEDDNDVNDDNDNSSPAPTTSGNSVLDAARQRSNLSVFYRAAANAGLNDTLASSTVQATVCAPTNDALDDFLENFDLTRSQFINTPAFSRLVLQYHVIPGSALRASQLSNDQRLTTALRNYRVTVNTDRDEEDDDDSDVQIQAAHSDAGVRTADITAGQAIVHTIGSVLIPPRGFWLSAVQGQAGAPASG